MVKTIQLIHDYPYPADLVWNVATDLDHLQTAVQGLLKFKNLPSGKITQGQHLVVEVSLFGKLPYQPYEMTVVVLDNDQRMFESSEVGSGVKSWRHRLKVIETITGSRIEESIEIDAGVKTWIFAAWAKFMYQKRHQPRLDILQKKNGRLSASVS